MQLYDLLSSTSFAITILLALAIASVLGILLIDQVPFRGEVARQVFPDRQGEPWIWFLSNLVPARPFRCFGFRLLLALLSLSLVACTIKRWRHNWRQATSIRPLPAATFDSGAALIWRTRAGEAAGVVGELLRKRLFAVRREEPQGRGGEGTPQLVASRFGIARLGSVLTHLGLLALVVGGLVMASTGISEMAWMRPGESVYLPRLDARLELEDFRIEMAPSGRVSAYISQVRLLADTTLVRATEIKVNRPLRYQGVSFYQASYRHDPTRVAAVDLVIDLAPERSEAAEELPPEQSAARAADPSAMMGGPHGRGRTSGFAMPMTVRVPWGEQVVLAGTPYQVAIDTFFVDFRIGDQGPTLASQEPRNPAVQIRFFAGDSLLGHTWYFLRHPDMAVGTGPEVPLMLGDYTPELIAGIEVATHPGAGWVWVGIVLVSLGTMLSFLLRPERAWVRLRAIGGETEIALVHQGASKQPPEFVKADWEAAATALGIGLTRRLPPSGGNPRRGTGV